MKTFYMTVTETLVRTIEVHANDVDEAYEKVENACNDGTIELDWSDFREREITDETEQTLDCYELGGMPKFYEIQ